jgi:hypothetical protein
MEINFVTIVKYNRSACISRLPKLEGRYFKKNCYSIEKKSDNNHFVKAPSLNLEEAKERLRKELKKMQGRNINENSMSPILKP